MGGVGGCGWEGRTWAGGEGVRGESKPSLFIISMLCSCPSHRVNFIMGILTI